MTEFTMNLLKKPLAILMACSLMLATSCGNKESAPLTETSEFQEAVFSAMHNYADMVHANYSDALADAQLLHSAAEAFVASPSESTLATAKSAWLKARESYGQTEAFRFYGGPIDGKSGIEGRLNAWPLDESYIDYVEMSANGGGSSTGTNIINNPKEYPEINKAVIAELNEVGAETNVSTGYHAVEFLLWGQDKSEGPGGGNRPFTDYVTESTGTHSHQERRGQYLLSATGLIVDDLQSLVNEWKPESGEYRKFFLSEAERINSLERVIGGLGKLSKGELAGERIFVPWDLRSKEDEQSCFSDNTHRDIVVNAQGILNVYTGTYIRNDGSKVTGTSIQDLVALANEGLAQEVGAKIEQSLEAAKAIQPPFDQEILDDEGRKRVAKTIKSLRTQGDLLAEAATLFGFTFDPEDV